MSTTRCFHASRSVGRRVRQWGQRRQITEFLRRLREHPGTSGDYADKDAALRERQVKIVGDYAVIYWVDDAVRAVMLVDIRAAGR